MDKNNDTDIKNINKNNKTLNNLLTKHIYFIERLE